MLNRELVDTVLERGVRVLVNNQLVTLKFPIHFVKSPISACSAALKMKDTDVMLVSSSQGLTSDMASLRRDMLELPTDWQSMCIRCDQ